MSWITDDWRLKLLALGLSVLMLGAVAFSQNPSTQKTINKIVSYSFGANKAIIIINQQTTVAVRVTGLSDTLQSLTDRNISADVDASRAAPGPAVKLNISITTQAPGVTILNPVVPIVVNIDQLQTSALHVQVTTPRPVTGWELTKAVATCPGSQSLTPCVVNYTGPASWEVGLKAVATFPGQIDLSDQTVFNVPINLVQADNSPLPDTPTVPVAGLDVPTVDLHVTARTGSTSTTVPLVDAPPSPGPPSGYRIVGITISPATVVITGDQAVLAKIQSIPLPAVSLSGDTSTVTIRVNIPYPNGVTPASGVAIAAITYQIAPNPNASPSP
jgi:YbbR domain-containing protein